MRLRNTIFEWTVQAPLEPPTQNGQYYRLRVYDTNRRNDQYTYINGTVLVHHSETNLVDFLSQLNPKDRIVVNGHLLDVNTFVGRDGSARATLMVLASGTNSVSLVRRAQTEDNPQAQGIVEQLVDSGGDDIFESDPFLEPLES